ncbi:MAG: hypothetical protein CSA19_00025 [Deltaproteobacteria bacterium]|nr:MAG: hypothetical protein CSA19_00025 [Deltaproteobacteria bacterium]
MKPQTRFKKLGIKHFQRGEHDLALKFFSIASQYEDQEAEFFVLLTSLALDMPDEAANLFEFYSLAKHIDKRMAYSMGMSFLSSIEANMSESFEKVRDAYESEISTQDGISYDDFKTLLKESGNFKDVFHKVIASTKVIITSKEDFFEFIENLIKNGFIDIALNYIDGANEIFPFDSKIRELLNLIGKQGAH